MALTGYVTRCAPECKAWHEAGSSGGFKSARARRNALANRWLTLVKNENALLLLRDLPVILMFEVIYYGMRLVRRPAFALDLVGALGRFLRLLPHAWRRRRISPIHLTLAQEASLLEPGMVARCAALVARYTGRKAMKSLWTKTEAPAPRE